jgi:hypothetical protein
MISSISLSVKGCTRTREIVGYHQTLRARPGRRGSDWDAFIRKLKPSRGLGVVLEDTVPSV